MDRPVDVFAAVEHAGAVLAFAPLGPTSGLYLPQPGRPPGILIHEGHPRTRQRYTAGHELGHHVFEHRVEADGDLEGQLRRGEAERWPDHEKEAEAFGAWFLMPRQLVRHALGQLGLERPHDHFDVYALSLWLGTSYTATARHLATIKLASDPQADQWARIPPRDIKRALAQELVPDDLHNDVWWLDERHNGQTLEARPGDRLVLTLEEIPSSGISWETVELPEGCRILAYSFTDDFEPRLAGGMLDPHDDVAGASCPGRWCSNSTATPRPERGASVSSRARRGNPSVSSRSTSCRSSSTGR